MATGTNAVVTRIMYGRGGDGTWGPLPPKGHRIVFHIHKNLVGWRWQAMSKGSVVAECFTAYATKRNARRAAKSFISKIFKAQWEFATAASNPKDE